MKFSSLERLYEKIPPVDCNQCGNCCRKLQPAFSVQEFIYFFKELLEDYTEEDIEKAIDFVKTFNVTVNFAGKGVTWDSERCTHCGHCVPHCPTAALHIADELTREVAFEDQKCIECLACIRVCPYDACASAF